MSFNLKNALAILKPSEQAEIFRDLAERLHQPSLIALASYYQALLEEKSSASEEGAMPEAAAVDYAHEAQAADRVREEVAPYGAQNHPTPRFEELYATFDGEVLRPENRINLAADRRYRLFIDKVNPEDLEIRIQAFKHILEDTIASGTGDFAEQHDHYLYGMQKK